MQKGRSSLLIVLAALALLALVVYVVKNQKMDTMQDTKPAEEEEMVVDDSEEFEDIPEDEKTPDEINNDVLNELDDLMQSIDEDTTIESISDLEV